MKLEEQVCSLDLAKKLKELGVKQESYFYWSYDNERYRLVSIGKHSDNYSAFTVAELGEMLPNGCRTTRTKRDGWVALKFLEKKIVFTADTEADARAKMLIYLLENELLTLPKEEIT